MRMRKIISLLLAVLLALLCLTGCGGREEPSIEEPSVQAEETVDAPVPEPAPSAAEETPAEEPETPAPPTPMPEASLPEPTPEPPAPVPQTCTISISCASVFSHLSEEAQEEVAYLPADGVILASTERQFAEGDSVFDVLRSVCLEKGIHLEFSETPIYQSMYIEGIANLYEFDFGDLSGWVYTVNGTQPNVGCSSFPVSAGDRIVWTYTTDFLSGE